MPSSGYELSNCVFVAVLADGDIMPRRFLAPRRAMRIVTGCTGHRSGAHLKTGRLAKPVSLIHNFKTFFTVAVRRAVKMNGIVCKRLAWAVGEYAAIEAAHRIRKARAGGFQMALHAYFEIPVG